MTGYSQTPLVKKLGFQENDKVYIKGAPDNYQKLIESLPSSVMILKRLSSNLDMIHLFTLWRKELLILLPKYVAKIKPNGMIWVSWPKKASKVTSDISEDVVRECALPLGLVDIKVCAVDDTWSGLKLVIRKEKRNAL